MAENDRLKAFRLSTEMFDRLHTHALELGITDSEVIRRCIGDGLVVSKRREEWLATVRQYSEAMTELADS